VRIIRAILLPLQATVFGIRELLHAHGVSRREAVDMGEALDRRSAELQSEADEEAERDEWRRRVFEGMPPPP
jgi:hypothetical protein